MSTRRASCSCGQLAITLEGDPVRVSVCHCLACQKRTGSAFGVQARFARDRIARTEGTSRAYTRIADSGNPVAFHFCPECGAIVWWEPSALPGHVAVPVGAFEDPAFPAPTISIYEARRHAWAAIDGEGVEHLE